MKKTTTNKKIERRCCVCYVIQDRTKMIRIAKSKTDNKVSVDHHNKISGRGVYICKDTDCYKTVKKQKRFEQALRCKIPEEIYTEINNYHFRKK